MTNTRRATFKPEVSADSISGSDINKNVSSGFMSLQLITTSCHAILNTIFIAPDPKPEWFDELNSKLDTVKTYASEWVNTLAAKVTSSVPGDVINFGTTYAAFTDQISKLVEQDPTAKGKDNKTVQETMALINALSTEVSKIIKEADEVAAELASWGAKMQSSHDELTKGASNIQSAEIALQGDITKMNEAIQNLHLEIDAQNKIIAGMAITVGVSIFVMVVGVALAPETGGYSLIATATGGLALIGGAITWGVMQQKINDEFDEIAKDQKTISSDQRQIVALQGLSAASNSAIGNINNATQALSNVKTMWASFSGLLNDVTQKLNSADYDLYAIVNQGYVLGAQKEWNLAVDYANNLSSMGELKVEAKVLPMSEAA